MPDPTRKSGSGFDYVHSLVDDHSRLAYSEILPEEKGATCAGFLRRAAAHFRTYGITRIERVMTDNAWAYRWSIREVCAELDPRQVFIRNAERTVALEPWLEHYNTRRRHGAPGRLPPASN